MRISLPEQVALEFRPAGYGSRSLAYMFDFFIRWSVLLLVPVLVILLVLWTNGEALFDGFERAIDVLSSSKRTSARDVLIAVITLTVFVVEWGYPLYFEVLRGGVTPGKRALGLRVIDLDGLPITFRASLIRTTFLIVDLTVSLSFVGLISMAATKKRQRLGDLVAGTVVVYDEEKVRETDLSIRLGTQVADGEISIPADLYAALQVFLNRRYELFSEVRSDLAGELARRLEKYDSQAPASRTAEDYIESAYPRTRPKQQSYSPHQNV